MSEFLIALLMGLSFIFGFWIGVDWYRKKIIAEEIIAQEARTKRGS
tara:strand:- start:871 stop:1008 length:138 start_codon:yes stop_codon:yes gene_type:complete